MQRFLAFIPRRWRLARWQVLLGVAATVAWWLFLYNRLGHFSVAPVDLPPLHGPWSDDDLRAYSAKLYARQLSEAWSDAYLALPAWFVFWLSVIAVRWASANIPLVARALAEIAAFAAMIGVAMLVTYLFPERHFWHGEVSRDAAYSPVVFASVLICEVALYIAWRVLNALKPAVIRPVDHAIEAAEPADTAPSKPSKIRTSLGREEELGRAWVQGAPYASIITEALRSKLPSLGTTAWIVAIVLIAAYLLMADGIPASELPQTAAFVVALIWLLLWAIATVFMPRTVSKPKYALAVLIVLTIAISIAAQGYRHNAEQKAARTQRAPGPRVPATVDQKPPAECATAKNVEECADTASGQPTNCYTIGNQTHCYSYEPLPPYRPTEPYQNDSGYGVDGGKDHPR